MKKIFSLLIRLKQFIAIRTYDEYSIADFYRQEFGVTIGSNCRIMGKRLNQFGSEPYLISIGNNVTITEDVKFITHDGGVGIFRKEIPGLNVFGKIVIKDNCFIGVNSVLLPNIVIGPNAVVGAGAVVTKDVPENTVVAGVPAKRLMSIEEYKDKALQKGLIILNVNIDNQDKVLKHTHTDRSSNFTPSP